MAAPRNDGVGQLREILERYLAERPPSVLLFPSYRWAGRRCSRILELLNAVVLTRESCSLWIRDGAGRPNPATLAANRFDIVTQRAVANDDAASDLDVDLRAGNGAQRRGDADAGVRPLGRGTASVGGWSDHIKQHADRLGDRARGLAIAAANKVGRNAGKS